MDCKKCFKICEPIPSCLDTLIFITDQISQPLAIYLQDKFDNIYIKSITSNVNGVVTIDLTDDSIYPASLINEFAGDFILTVKNVSTIIPFKIGGKEYDCIIFNSAKVSPQQNTYILYFEPYNECIVENFQALFQTPDVEISFNSITEINVVKYFVERYSVSLGQVDKTIPITATGSGSNYNVTDDEIFEDISLYKYSLIVYFKIESKMLYENISVI